MHKNYFLSAPPSHHGLCCAALMCAHPALEGTSLDSPHTPHALKPSLESNVSFFPTGGHAGLPCIWRLVLPTHLAQSRAVIAFRNSVPWASVLTTLMLLISD